MLSWLIGASLRQPVVVVALAAILVILGFQAVRSTPLDVFPEFAEPRVEIQTEAPGLSTEEVEQLVTVPIENAVNGTAWLKTVRSKTVLGLSSVVCLFAEGTDLLRARQLVQERIAVVAPRLPLVAHAPVILPPLSSTSRALMIGVSSPTLSQMDLTDVARWTIRPRLMAVPGVANVAIWGERRRQLQVLVDPDHLAAHGVSLDAVVRTATDAAAVAAGGFVDTPTQRLPLRQVGAVGDVADLAAVPVQYAGGTSLTLGQLAEVGEGYAPPIGDAVINDGPGLLLIVEKQPWGNTLDVTRGVDAALELLRPALRDVEVDPTIFRPATFIEQALHNLRRALLLGCALVAVVLFAFLYEWRTALISLVAIPLSLLTAAVVLHLSGGTLNTMVIAGLVIAVGEVVDDAIIDVENIMRRLRQNRAAATPLPAIGVVLRASLEVRSAVVFASVIVALVFLPVFLMDGLAGTFFRPLAVAYVLAILASLLVALTVTPALSLLLLARAPLRAREAPLVSALKRRYRALLPALLRRPRLVLATLVAIFAVTAASVPFLGEEFLPQFKERDFLMHWIEKPGTSLDAMRRITVAVSQELRRIPGVRNFGSHLGRAEVADEVVGPNFTELWISLDPSADYDASVAKIQAVIAGYPGLVRDVLTYLKERIKEVLSGASATMVVRIYGPELSQLRSYARQVGDAMSDIPGVVDLHVEPQVLIPQIEARLRLDVAATFGVTPGMVQRAVSTLVQGTRAGEVYRGERVADVTVWGAPGVRQDVQALRALVIETPSGARVPLGDLADVAIVPAPNEIKRERASRRIDVTCNVDGADLGDVARAIEARLAGIDFARGYHAEMLGEYTERQQSTRRLLLWSALALLGILVLLHVDFRQPRLVLLVTLSLPFALVGGVVGAFLSGGALSLGSMVGFVTVLGIAARNGIMLISHYRHLEQVEGEPFGRGLVERGAEERLAPILMTAACAALALLPIALSGNVPGHEIEYPMAAVILGGLVTSTGLNLFAMPALYAAFGHGAEPPHAPPAHQGDHP